MTSNFKTIEERLTLRAERNAKNKANLASKHIPHANELKKAAEASPLPDCQIKTKIRTTFINNPWEVRKMLLEMIEAHHFVEESKSVRDEFLKQVDSMKEFLDENG